MDNGLCDRCAWQKLIRTGRGSVFSMCLRAKLEAGFEKYPRVPVGACPGYEVRPPVGDDDGRARS